MSIDVWERKSSPPTHLHDRRVSLPSPGPTAAPYRESGTPHTANGAAPRRGCARDIRRCKSTPHISTPYFTCEAGDESVYVSVRSRSAVDMISISNPLGN